MEEVNSALLKKDTNLEKVILFFHGGGFIGKLNSIYSNLMYKLCKQLPDYKIIAVEYRTLREHIFPNALNDSIIAWEYLMSEKYNPNNIIILGDSAGGNLGLALTMYLRDCGIFPKAYIGLSPWVNLDMDAIENIEKKSLDPLFGSNNVLSILGKMYAGDYDIKDWKISPFYGDFKNLPKMFLSYGSLEILGDDIQALYEKAKDEVDIVLKVYNKCQHDVITSETKEGKIALNDVVDFINSL
jgi:acetyl esterase/lipase